MTNPPRLSRQKPVAKPGIIHFGPGAFFKAFNAVYTDDAMAAEGGDWGIIAVSLKSDRAARELGPQGGVYTSVALARDGQRTQIINAISAVLTAPDDPKAVLQAMTDPAIKIVSLTITEKGYCHNPATGELLHEHADILADLETPHRPKTALGFIVEALARRRAAGHPPFTVLSCDNLPENGAMAKRVILEFARARDAGLHDWIASEARFPATMVDRITPATTSDDIETLSRTTGYHDPACVLHEPFRQWVIEDDFVCGRPAWDAAGAQFVTSVSAHELMKLRCLNGTHSALAYLGYLAGFQTIAEAVADPVLSRFCERLWQDEILPTVPAPEGEDLQNYVAGLLTRYQNPAIRHRTWQIAMDGSQKLPQRILGTIQDRLNAGEVPHGLCIAVAAWIRYVSGIDDAGYPIDVRDPLVELLAKTAAEQPDHAARVSAYLDVAQVFDRDLAADKRFRSAVTDAYKNLVEYGALETLRLFCKE